MQNFHAAMRATVQWPGGQAAPRPVHLNTWEAVYFDHELDDLKDFATAGGQPSASSASSSTTAGSTAATTTAARWATGGPTPRKYPDGLAPLADHVTGLGMQFGLWVEPEMVNPDSELYRAHPEWAFAAPGRRSRPGATSWCSTPRCPKCRTTSSTSSMRCCGTLPIRYLKWDMNRDLTQAVGADGRAGYLGFVQGLYALLARRARRAPRRGDRKLCLRRCARMDCGRARPHPPLLDQRQHRCAVARGHPARIPAVFPARGAGRPHRARLRTTPPAAAILDFRAGVALFGHLGLEQDVRLLDADTRDELARWIGVYKQWRDLVHSGELRQGMTGQALRWTQVTNADKSAALWAVYRLREETTRDTPAMLIEGLDPARDYRIEPLFVLTFPYSTATSDVLDTLAAGELVLSGTVLRDYGLPLPPQAPEAAVVIGLRAI